MSYDLMVIGLGLSGLMAAKTAADSGRKVLLVGRGAGSLCILSNSIDVLAYEREGTLKEAFTDWTQAHPEHPYAKVGWEALETALNSFSSLFASPYRFTAPDGKNSLIPTGAGTRRPTYLLPDTFLAGSGAKKEKTLIVGIDGFKDFHPEYVAHHLKSRGISVILPPEDKVRTAAGLANLMDKPDFVETFAKLIRKRLAGEGFIGVPAVLGLRSPASALEIIEGVTGCRVFEIPILPPSIPGTRVFHRFLDHLLCLGVTIIQGHEVQSLVFEEKKCVAAILSHPPLTRTYRADNFILATGRFLGGGLKADENRIYEPLLGLPVVQPPARRDWFGRHFFPPQAHPIHEAGIRTDRQLRPLDAAGNVLWENLRVAGSILAHHNAMREFSREGVALSTGYAAARYSVAGG